MTTSCTKLLTLNATTTPRIRADGCIHRSTSPQNMPTSEQAGKPDLERLEISSIRCRNHNLLPGAERRAVAVEPTTPSPHPPSPETSRPSPPNPPPNPPAGASQASRRNSSLSPARPSANHHHDHPTSSRPDPSRRAKRPGEKQQLRCDGTGFISSIVRSCHGGGGAGGAEI